MTQVACGDCHTLALTKTGEIYAFGSNQRGELGIENRNSHCPMPVRLQGVPPCKAVLAAEASMAVTLQGALLAWGTSDALGINGLPQPVNWWPKTKKVGSHALHVSVPWCNARFKNVAPISRMVYLQHIHNRLKASIAFLTADFFTLCTL